MAKKNRGKGNEGGMKTENKGLALQKEREQKKLKWTNGKVDRAKQDDYNVIRQKTQDVALFVSLGNSHDNIMEYLRLNNCINPRINIHDYTKAVVYSNLVKAMLDRVNAFAYNLKGSSYSSPANVKGLLRSIRETDRDELKKSLHELVDLVLKQPEHTAQPKAVKTEKPKAAKPAQAKVAPVPVATPQTNPAEASVTPKVTPAATSAIPVAPSISAAPITPLTSISPAAAPATP